MLTTDDEIGPSGTSSSLRRRRRWLAFVVVASVAASVGGVVGSLWIKSPAEVAADTAPPPATLLTAQVVERVLSSTIVLRSTGVSGRRMSFTPSASAASASGPAATKLVVTRRPVKVGARVRSGQVVLEISQRPVFVLTGKVAMFRDLIPGERGKDVAQLQSALAALGFASTDPRGYFGASTALAVKRFYTRRGYDVPYTDAVYGDKKAFSSAGEKEAVTSDGHVIAVPMSELMFLSSFPAHVVKIGAAVGREPRGAALTLTTGDVSLVARLPPDQASLVRAGMRAKVLDEADGFTGKGKVSAVGNRRKDANGDYIPVTVSRAKGWPQALVGQDVRVTLTAAATDAAVLVVPEAAVTASADGQTFVTVVAGTGEQRVVPVAAGASADGWVEVSALTAGDLDAGDSVVTGR